MRCNAADLMSQALTVDPEASMEDAAKTMDVYRISCMPVVDAGGELCGILSKTDVLHHLVAGEEQPGARVRELMSPAVVTCGPDAGLVDVARSMQGNRVHHVVVVDEGNVAGVISALDLTDPMCDLVVMLGSATDV